MKKNLRTLGILAFAALLATSCTKEDAKTAEASSQLKLATPASFKGIKEKGLSNIAQSFTMTAGTGVITMTSKKGVQIKIDGNALTKDGNPVTGDVKIDFVEIFDKGTMLVTNKATMGLMADGKQSMLKSGGEFFIKATQGGVALETTSNINLVIPANLTGTADPEMILWDGNKKDPENLVWEQRKDANGGKGGVNVKENNYYVSFGNFGWTNVDKFYSDPRPRTMILAGAPAGYDNTNSAIYLSYDGEGANALAKLDTYITATSLFSEHYGQIPIGLQCHVIFATEDSGQWRYAIKAVTVAANDVYNFTLAETTLGTEAQLVAAINAIQ
jgi:hypothetical protein